MEESGVSVARVANAHPKGQVKGFYHPKGKGRPLNIYIYIYIYIC
jgi:hypothetical protein